MKRWHFLLQVTTCRPQQYRSLLAHTHHLCHAENSCCPPRGMEQGQGLTLSAASFALAGEGHDLGQSWRKVAEPRWLPDTVASQVWAVPSIGPLSNHTCPATVVNQTQIGPRGDISQCPETFFGGHSRGTGAPGILWVEASGAANTPQCTGQTPQGRTSAQASITRG